MVCGNCRVESGRSMLTLVVGSWWCGERVLYVVSEDVNGRVKWTSECLCMRVACGFTNMCGLTFACARVCIHSAPDDLVSLPLWMKLLMQVRRAGSRVCLLCRARAAFESATAYLASKRRFRGFERLLSCSEGRSAVGGNEPYQEPSPAACESP